MSEAGEGRQQTQIQEWVGRQEKAIAQLLECIDVLEPRLDSVLAPITADASAPKETTEPVLVELAERLRESTKSVISATERMRSILNRLEL